MCALLAEWFVFVRSCTSCTLQLSHNERDEVSNHRRPIRCTTVCSGAEQIKYQRFASLAFVGGNSPLTGEFPRTKGQ